MSLPTPNPFNPTTRIDFRVDGKARTTMHVFDVRGALVRTLVDENLPSGDHTVQWDGRNDQGAEVASGAYFVALVSGADLTSRKIALVK
jgi:flagellar hook assembly protein FlgD